MKVEVSMGEVFDKLSILSIKMKKITNPTKNANVTKEHDILAAEVDFSLHPKLYSLYNGLCEINLKLWDIEDAIRLKESRREFDQEFIELARSVYYTNDRRFEVKSEINKICNSSIVEEKQHVEYQPH
jgi:hypothetical protein